MNDSQRLECSDSLLEHCYSQFGIKYLFPWQRLVIASVLDCCMPRQMPEELTEMNDDPDSLRQIAVLPTGAGKSLCWMLPATLIPGISVAVFPLLSLMADQKRRLEECNIESVTLRGGMEPKERREIWRRLEDGKVRIVLANPEILGTEAVGSRLGLLKPQFLVIDETHTVSQWGESFRPACAQMGSLIEQWKPTAVLALTATAGPRIRSRIKELLFNGESPSMALANPDRPEIQYGVLPAASRNYSLTRLAREEPRPLIVFGPTRSSVERAARMLRWRLNDNEIRYYHAGMNREEKSGIEDWFLESDKGILCATCAYGMGVDKKNVRTIVHLCAPGSPEAYLQESGRASRDKKGARAWLLATPGDLETGGDSQQDVTNKTMLAYISDNRRCRREVLLESLDIDAEDCAGCDVCASSSWQSAPEIKIIMDFIRKNSKRFGKGTAARIMIGRKTQGIRRSGHDYVSGFAVLAGWELEDAEDALDGLISTGTLAVVKRGRRKGRLYLCRKEN